MKLVSNWKEVLQKAWSVWLMLLSVIVIGLEALLPTFVNLPFDSIWLKMVAAALPVAAIWARVTIQEGLSDDKDDV